jgi:Carbohydrate family 9 binding domain-like
MPNHEDSPTEIVAPFVNEPVSESVWQHCGPARINHYWSGQVAKPERHAEARICWSEEAIHVRFVCKQHEPLIVAANPVTDKKTLGLWDRDVCEIFLAPQAQNPWRYFEFEAAPTGEWVDLGILVKPSGRETDWDFRSGMTTTALVENTQLTIAMRIPWSHAIQKPEVGDEWKVNVFRCVGPESDTRYLAWRPTKTEEPNFHVPEAFGSLRFQ